MFAKPPSGGFFVPGTNTRPACSIAGLIPRRARTILLPMQKRGLQLDRVVLLGRTFEEYCHYFALDREELLQLQVLDIAGGVSSFTAEASALGCDVTAVDPIYRPTPEEIGTRCGPDLDHIYEAIQHLSVYRWNWYQTPQRMRALREQACTTFLEHFRKRNHHRYIAAGLPELPFPAREFDLSLVSYFLFVYQEQLSYEFHRDSILDIMRVTRGEARIYPTVTFEGDKSKYLAQVHTDPALGHLQFEEVATEFEFLAGSNSYLSIRHRPADSPAA